MSNIYIQEPPTNGKVLLKTTAGDIDIELWSKEAPLACRNFVQLCLEGYYDNTIFHRLVKGFVVQGGDPTGTGMGGESVYGQPFKDEFHSRLRFVRRGLVAMAHGGQRDDNGSQFFITLDATPELQNVHTIFGKVTGKTQYNVLTLAEGEVDQNERPLYPHKILKTEVLNNPFDDIVPREKEVKEKKPTKEEKARSAVKASKNFKLLSFGDEAEEEEEELIKVVTTDFKGKSKSSHDLLKDDKLSSVPVVDIDDLEIIPGDVQTPSSLCDDGDKKSRLSAIKEKLQSTKRNKQVYDDGEDEEIDFLEEERKEKKKAKIDSAKEEFNQLKKQFVREIKRRETSRSSDDDKRSDEDSEKETERDDEDAPVGDIVSEFKKQHKQFREKKKKLKKGDDREAACWDAIQRFRSKLQSAKSTNDGNAESSGVQARKTAWMTHRMQCTGDDEIVLARDANIRNEEDWYDIYDPRNAINKRRRNEK